MIHTGKLKRAEIYHNTRGETPEQIKAKTGCDTIVNGMLFNGDGTFCLKAKINGKTLANEDGNFYGYGWNANTAPVIAHSDRIADYDNYITSIHISPTVARGRTAISFYDGKYTVLCTSDSNGAMTIAQVEQAMKQHNSQFLILDGGGSSYLDCLSGKVDTSQYRKTANRMYLLIWEETEQKKDGDKLNIQQNLTNVNFNSRGGRKIEWIVVHYFGALASAKDTCQYFKSVNRQASAHYFVDENNIYQCVLDKDVSWHCGDSGAGTYKGKCTNANSIGIETRPHKLNTSTMSATDNDWYFDPKTADNLCELIRYLMDKHNIDADHVIRHYDVTSKWCPRPFMGDDYNPYFQKTGNQIWNEFKKRLTSIQEPTTPVDGTIYRVQVGAFTVRDNANKLKADLESRGYKPYIVEGKK